MRPSVFIVLVHLATGCAVAMDEPVPVAVFDPLALTPVPAELDPFADHRPARVYCPPATWGAEGGGFEIQTGACNYAAFDQPLPVSVEAGDELQIVLWHDFLDAPEPATAHLALWLGPTVLVDEQVDIPAPSKSFEVVVPIETTPPPGARLGLHLHNHGFNSWRLVTVDVLKR